MSGNRQKRLEKIEQKLANVLRQDALVNCTCLERLFVNSTEKLRSEMRKTCPVHGFRRLGVVTLVSIGPKRKDSNHDDPLVGAEEVVEEYKRGLAQAEQAEDEQDYEWQEP